MAKLNDCNHCECLDTIKLTKERFPIAFQNKVEELIEEGFCGTQEEAEKAVEGMDFELEIYYEKGVGLFAVECEAVACGRIYSPYTTEPYEDYE